MANRGLLSTLLDELERFGARIRSVGAGLEPLSPHSLRKLREASRVMNGHLVDLFSHLDPVRNLGAPFNPASPEVFSESIANKLLLQPPIPLSALDPFYGSGVYALFYRGGYRAYKHVSGSHIPLYVGKANPENSRATTAEEQGTKLFTRIAEHRDSIAEAEAHPSHSLRLRDFECRFLVVDSAWQVVSEAYLIRTFQPVWNKETKICMGIGKHGDDFTTRGNRRSAWDTLHPGRAWAKTGKPSRRSEEDIIKDVINHSLMYLEARFAGWR